MAGQSEIVIELGRRRLIVIYAGWEKDRLVVRRTISVDLPSDMDRDDPEEVGRWIGATLSEANIPRDRVIVALSRQRVALKRLTLPTVDKVELPQMTRLAMQSQLSFDPETAVIDFLPEKHDETSTTVLAVAVPQDVLEFMRRMTTAAGLRLECVSMRGMGAATLIGVMNGMMSPPAARVLVVDLVGENLELSVVDDGAIRFSRAAEIVEEENGCKSADTVIREIRRTWLSYRMIDEDSHVDGALLFGEQGITSETVDSIREILKMRTEKLQRHPRVDTNGAVMHDVWPLAGLLLGCHLNTDSINFVKPRRAPDIRARKRLIMLGCTGAISIILFGGWTLAKMKIEPLRQQLDTLKRTSASLAPEYRRYGRDLYKLEHLKRWESARVEWLDHATALAALSPAPDSVVLDKWTGTLKFRGVQYDHKADVWSAPREISIVLDGEARDRQTADAFRAALVSSNLYTASSGGVDAQGGRRLPYGFTYRLRTTVVSPEKASVVAASLETDAVEEVAGDGR